jgi:hypothetical protein
VGVSEGRIFSLQGGAFQISCGDLMASTLSLTRSFSTAVLHQVTLVCLACLISLEQQEASAGVLVQLGFNDITSSSISTVQHDTGNRLVYDATFADWDRAGFNAAHALQISGAVHGGLGDYALMIYGDNIATQKTGFESTYCGLTIRSWRQMMFPQGRGLGLKPSPCSTFHTLATDRGPSRCNCSVPTL